MKKLILILALAALFSCKKEATVSPSGNTITNTSQPQPAVKKDSVYKFEVSSNQPYFYEVTIKIFDGDGRLKISETRSGSVNGKQALLIKVNGIGVVTSSSYVTAELKWGTTNKYGSSNLGKFSVYSSELFMELPEHFIMTSSSGMGCI